MKIAPRDNRSAVSAWRLIVALTVAALIPILLYAGVPSWWLERGVLLESATADDYAPVNQGQLKNIAKAAVAEMDAKLNGGAGDELHRLIQSWSQPDPATNDFAPVNLGQLKTVAKPFYDRLIAAGLAEQYPWSAASGAPDDFAVANIGQVKNLFSFGLTSIHDSDNDGMSDSWELEHFGTINIDPTGDADGDGSTNLAEFVSGSDPKDFFNGVAAALQIISGNNQTGDPGAFLAEPLVVGVRKANGEPVPNAPVTFRASSGTFAPVADGGAPESSSLTVRTGPDGSALAYFRSPAVDDVSSVISAAADTPNANGILEFIARTNGLLPLPVTNVQAVTLPDGSVEISWVAGPTNEDYFVIKRQNVDGTWDEVGYADAGSLSFTLSPPRNAGAVPDTRNYIVERAKGDAVVPSAETNPARVRYAVVDLGSDLSPTRVTNSGYVLLSDGAITQRWRGGQLETLEGETPWGLDINEEGIVVGYVQSSLESPAYYFPPWFKSSAAVAWPVASTAPVILASPDFAYSINGTSGQVGSGYAFAIDNNGHIYGGALGNYAQRDEYIDANGEAHPTIWSFFHTGWNFSSGNALGGLSLSLVNDGFEVTGRDRVVDWARNGIEIGRVGADFGDPNWDYGSRFTFYSMNGAYRNTVNDEVVDFRPLRLNSSGTVLGMHMFGDPYARLLYNTADRSRKDLEITLPVTVWGPNLWAAAINHRRIPMLDPATGRPLVDANGQPRTKESPQVVGEDETLWDNAATIWEENPRTGRYEMEYLQRLISPDSGWELHNAYDINDHGMITVDGWYQPKDENGEPVGERQWRACLLLPIELRDVKKVTDQSDDAVIRSLPSKDEGESDNDYIQRQLPNECIAYVEPHAAMNNIDPEMPHLVAKLPQAPQGLKVKWRLEVDYQRLNGWRASYTTRSLHLDEDLVCIPAKQAGQQATFTREKDATEEWRIFEDPDWQYELTQRGFFGGTAKLYLWFPSQSQMPPTNPIISFRIGGKNPDPTIAKTFIQSHLCDNRLWFAYAIAKKESPNYDKPFYNQFFGSHRKGNGNAFDQNKDWQCWAKGWPVYNIDRSSRNGPMTSAGGYGIFQVTGDAQSQWTVIPRRQIWNWQDNVGYQKNNVWFGAMGILKAKIQFVDARYHALQETYPACGPVPNYPLNITSSQKRLSGWDAYTCKGYNGYGGTQPKIDINGIKKAQWSPWHPRGNRWGFVDDGYTLGVWKNVEEIN